MISITKCGNIGIICTTLDNIHNTIKKTKQKTKKQKQKQKQNYLIYCYAKSLKMPPQSQQWPRLSI